MSNGHLTAINHIVVLMFGNRSFDHIRTADECRNDIQERIAAWKASRARKSVK